MLTVLYFTITIFFIVLTTTTLASFYVGLQFWGIIPSDDPVEKDEPTEEISHAQFYWDNCVSESEKELFFESLEPTNELTDPATEDYPW